VSALYEESLMPDEIRLGGPQLIRKPEANDVEAGWDGPGWYFNDDEGDLHGPFETQAECAEGWRYWWDDTYDDGGI
jgi:hypothetical protein